MTLWSALVALPGCAPTSLGPEPPVTRGTEVACASEAEQLLQPVAVHAAPTAGSALLLDLAKGRFVYRCEARDDWLAIMFPAAGEAVDCAQRPAERSCTVGWVRGEVATAILG
jgi:hypothetical protein